ncbi:MAG: uracil-DNA glycosylase family protein [Pseudomonadota bacterium]
MAESFEDVAAEARACQVCAEALPHAPRPVLRGSSSARIQIIGQAPGTRVHASGMPFTDPSGDRLRGWMGVSEAQFYDEAQIAITPMGLCFPGLDAKGGDRPPRAECAPLWQARLRASLPRVQCTLLIGAYAQKRWLGESAKKTLTETVLQWRDFAPDVFALPHPSWRNNVWLKRNPWFENEVLPSLRLRIRSILNA